MIDEFTAQTPLALVAEVRRWFHAGYKGHTSVSEVIHDFAFSAFLRIRKVLAQQQDATALLALRNSTTLLPLYVFK